MIPDDRFSTETIRGQLLNPWSRDRKISYHWGPVQVQDPSQGLLVKVWTLRAEGAAAVLSAPGSPTVTVFTRGVDIDNVNLAFDQNGRPCVCFEEEGGGAYLYWFDPVPNEPTHMPIPGDAVSPRITLDDARPFNGANSDVILGYVRNGIVRYRQQRDRFTVEYTPPIGPGGSPASATGLRHISMNSNLRLEFLTDGAGDEDWVLADLVEEIAGGANVPPYRLRFDSGMYQVTVPGYGTSPDYPVDASIMGLAHVFFFDHQDADGYIRYMMRGGPAVATVTEDDMLEGQDEVEEDTTRDSISVPQLMHLSYFDVEGGQGSDKQQSERQLSERVEAPVSLATSVILTAEQSAKAVKINHKILEDQLRGTLKFALPEEWIWLTKGDPIIVQYRGRSVRGRIIDEQVHDGWQLYEVERERQSAYTAEVQPVPPAPITPPVSNIPGDTIFEFLNLPALTPANDALGYHIATSGVLPSWRGGVVEREQGGQFELLATDGAGSVMGTLLGPLPSAAEAYPDETNVIQVQLVQEDDSLDSTTTFNLLSGANGAAVVRPDGTAEVLQFRNADEVSPGVWELSYLVRGRLDSGATAHDAGARFVLLSGAMFIPSPISWVGEDITHRYYSFGELPDSGATQMRTWEPPLSQREWAPVITAASRAADTLSIAWIPRHRFGGDANPYPSVNFDGWQLTATDGTATRSAVLSPSAEAHALDIAGLSSPLTITLAALNRITGPGVPAEIEV